MRRNGASNLHTRHLTADDQDLLAAVARFVTKQALQVPILAARHNWDRGRLGEAVRDDGLAKVARGDYEPLKGARLLGPVGAPEQHLPPRAAILHRVGPHDAGAQAQLKVRVASEIAVQVALEVLADLPRTRELGRGGIPGKVAEVHGVAALVGHHERMDQPARVRLGRRP